MDTEKLDQQTLRNLDSKYRSAKQDQHVRIHKQLREIMENKRMKHNSSSISPNQHSPHAEITNIEVETDTQINNSLNQTSTNFNTIQAHEVNFEQFNEVG